MDAFTKIRRPHRSIPETKLAAFAKNHHGMPSESLPVPGNLDEFRLKTLKSSSSNNLRKLPPSRSGLELHVRRASNQAGWVWGNAISQEPTPKLSEFGWIVVDGKPNILWSTDGTQTDIIDAITKTCKC